MATMTPQSVTRRYSVLMFLFSVAMALPAGVIILFIQGRGIDLLEVGVLVAIQALTVVVLELPTGGLADVWGRKKVVLLAFATGTAGSLVSLSSFSFPLFTVAMLFIGASAALFSGTMEALFVDSLREIDPDVNLQKYMAIPMATRGIGMALGAVLGGFMPRWFTSLPEEGTAMLTPLSTPLFLALVVWIVTFAASAILIYEPSVPRPEGSEEPPTQLGFKAVVDVMRNAIVLSFKDRLILVLMVISALYALAFAPIEAFWQPHFADLQQTSEVDTRAFGAIAALLFLFGAIGSGIASVVSRWTGKHYGMVCAVGMFLLTISFVVFSVQTRWGLALAAFFGIHVVGGALVAAFQPLFNSAIPSDKRATLVSFQSLAMKIGVFVGGLTLGYVAQYFAIPLAFRYAAVALLAGVPLFVYADRLHMALDVSEDELPAGPGPQLSDASFQAALAEELYGEQES